MERDLEASARAPGAVFEIPVDREHDPREQQAWFLRLPEEARDELRERWRRSEGASRAQRRRRRDTAFAWVGEAVLLLWVLNYLALRALPASLAVGAALGLLGWRLKPGHLLYGAMGATAFALVVAASGTFSLGSLFAFVLAAAGSSVLAQTHRLQRFDGTEL